MGDGRRMDGLYGSMPIFPIEHRYIEEKDV